MRFTNKQPEYAEFEIGDWTYGFPTIVKCAGDQGKLKIGKFCSISENVRILLGGEHDFQNRSTYPFGGIILRFSNLKTVHTKGDITIGSDVWIGHSVLILSGVTIGDGAIIGAGSVVSSDVPPYAIAAGNPARVIRYRFSQDEITRLLEMRWWDLPWNGMRKLIPWLMSHPEERKLIRL